jgi:hypothetical protein
MRAGRLPPVTIRRQEKPRTHDICGAGAKLGRGLECALDRRLRLPVGVAGMQDAPVGERRRAADCDVRPETDGAGVGGGFSEAAAVPDSLSPYGLKVIVRCVVILPPAYLQISYTADPGSPFLSQSIGPQAPS